MQCIYRKRYRSHNNHTSTQRGFTLIEALVSVSVFAIAMTSIVGVFLAVQRLNQETLALQSLQQNGRFIAEDITKIVRNGSVDYDAYGTSVPHPSTDDLYLIDQDGSAVHIYRQDQTLFISRDGASAPFTGDEVRVLEYEVYITPEQNPFNPSVPKASREQPTVTVFLELEATASTGNALVIPFQITSATKEYPVIQ